MWKNFKVYIVVSDVSNSENKGKTEAAYLGNEKESRIRKRKRLMTPRHEFLRFKQVYLYLWTNSHSWPFVIREYRNNSSTLRPLIRNHGFRCHLVVAVRKCINQVLEARERLWSPRYTESKIKDLKISAVKGKLVVGFGKRFIF